MPDAEEPLCGVSHDAKFERNRYDKVRMQANVKRLSVCARARACARAWVRA